MAWPPVGFAGVAAPAAHAANLGVLVSCPFMEQAYATQNVATPSQYRRERTGWCVINDARRHVGAPPLLNQSERQASSLGDAQRAVALRWWCLTDGLVSHVDPSQSGMTPSAAIAQRIANAGLGPKRDARHPREHLLLVGRRRRLSSDHLGCGPLVAA